MAQTAAHRVDHVIPHAPVRQRVLSLPIPLRLLLAAQPRLLTPMLQVVHRVITRHLLGQAGLKAAEAVSGAVTLMERFGSAAHLNVHVLCLVLDGMHDRGLLRIARRDAGVRVYAAREATPPPADAAVARARHDALVDLVLATYAPLPTATLGQRLSDRGGGVPQWRGERAAALSRAKTRHPSARIDGIDWFWPAGEHPRATRRSAARPMPGARG